MQRLTLTSIRTPQHIQTAKNLVTQTLKFKRMSMLNLAFKNINTRYLCTSSKINVSTPPKQHLTPACLKLSTQFDCFETKHPKGRNYAINFLDREYAKTPQKVGYTVLHGAKAFRDMLGIFGNVMSGNIGEHYESEAKPILDMNGSARNCGALVGLETYHWKNTEHQASRELGSAMTELQRFGVLMHTQEALSKDQNPLPTGLALSAFKTMVMEGQAKGFEVVARTEQLTPEQLKGFEEGMAIWEKVKAEHTKNGVFNRETGIPALKQALELAEITEAISNIAKGGVLSSNE